MNTSGSVVVCVNVLQYHRNGGEESRAILCNQVLCQAGEGATDAYVKIQKAFGNDSLSCVEVFQWHKDFVNGQEMVEDQLRSWCPASVRTSRNVDCVSAFIRQDKCLTI
jgi:hypothetical protein